MDMEAERPTATPPRAAPMMYDLAEVFDMVLTSIAVVLAPRMVTPLAM